MKGFALLLGIAVVAALRPRSAAPAWKAQAVINEKFQTLSNADYAGKWQVLLFYPFDFTFVCPTELIAFSEAVEDFAAINAHTIGISTDSHHTHLAWVRTPRASGGLGAMNIPLVGDVSKDIARDYDVLVTEKDDGMYGAALRGLFIIDPAGKIRSMQINDDAVGRSVDETLRLIKAFQWADKHGEVCPANWKPGDATMVPDPDASKDYFAKANA